MYRYVDGSPTLVHDFNHLLIAVTLRHAYQSAKLTNTMIDMYHIVANLKLLNLLQRQGHLTTSGLVGTQVVLMEAVEYLVVGKYAELLVVVGKTFVEGLFDRIEDPT